MYVCICNRVTDEQIRLDIMTGKVSSLADLRRLYSLSNGCGKCAWYVQGLIDEELAKQVKPHLAPTAHQSKDNPKASY